MTINEDHKITFMFGSGTKTTTAGKLTPMRALRAKCLDCASGSPKEVRICYIPECPLWAYRFGKRPESVADASLLEPDHVRALADQQSARELAGYRQEDDGANSAENPVHALLGGVSAQDGADPDTLTV